MQRHAVFPWSGDVNRSWSGLQAQVPIMVGMGQAGVGYMHSDAGGFGANATQDPELYTRWLQLAALCPIMRPHSDQVVAPEPYTYPEPYQSIVRNYAHLRYQLLPYLYTLAAQNTLTGAPLARAMDFEDSYELRVKNDELALSRPAINANEPDDGGSWKEPDDRFSLLPNALSSSPAAALPPPDDQYLLGPNLLVAPVSQPGQRRRNVALPLTPGGWVDFETGQTLPGGQTVGLPAPLGRIPLLARAGAIIPATAYRSSTAAFRPDTLLVRYFPDWQVPTPIFTMYEDDGHSAQALARKEYATIRFTGKNQNDQTIITATVAGSYPGAPARRLVRLRVARVAAAPAAVRLGRRAAGRGGVAVRRRPARASSGIFAGKAGRADAQRLATADYARRPNRPRNADAYRARQPHVFPGGRAALRALRTDRRPYPPAHPQRAGPSGARAAHGRRGRRARRGVGRAHQAPGLYEVELDGQHQRLVRLP